MSIFLVQQIFAKFKLSQLILLMYSWKIYFSNSGLNLSL